MLYNCINTILVLYYSVVANVQPACIFDVFSISLLKFLQTTKFILNTTLFFKALHRLFCWHFPHDGEKLSKISVN